MPSGRLILEHGGSAGILSKVQILGQPVDVVTMEQAMDRIESLLAGQGSHLVITADASGIVQANEDPELAALYQSASLVTPDGVGVVWAAKRQGVHVPAKVSGVDLVAKLCEASAKKGYRIFLLGAEPGVADAAAKKLSELYPGCQIVGSRHGYFKPDQDEAVAREVAQAKPEILFVAMGIPRQEKFIAATMKTIGAKVSMGVGGSFDVYSGKTKRAPAAFQKLHLEWLWRLLLNPKKISKVKLLPRFVRMVISERK